MTGGQQQASCTERRLKRCRWRPLRQARGFFDQIIRLVARLLLGDIGQRLVDVVVVVVVQVAAAQAV